MRKKVSGFVTVRAISGTYVVFLAFDMKEADAKGLRGFAIQRTDLTESETIWLRGNKTFASIRPSTGIEDASSHEHPFQAFQWADYAAKPGYTYKNKRSERVRQRRKHGTDRGDKRVADIYFGEFMRVFAHHRFRESVKKHIAQFGSAAFNTWKPQDLFEDWKKWVPGQFRAGLFAPIEY